MFLFHYLFSFLYKAEEEAIKVKSTPMHLEIPNHIINDLNINISEEVNAKACKSLPVSNQFV